MQECTRFQVPSERVLLFPVPEAWASASDVQWVHPDWAEQLPLAEPAAVRTPMEVTQALWAVHDPVVRAADWAAAVLEQPVPDPGP
ncbi:MAG: hypothetical protein UY35_C0034G0001, partial [Candidatus Saccharibacteria bacterium GW2011_GWC2_48_9]